MRARREPLGIRCDTRSDGERGRRADTAGTCSALLRRTIAGKGPKAATRGSGVLPPWQITLCARALLPIAVGGMSHRAVQPSGCNRRSWSISVVLSARRVCEKS